MELSNLMIIHKLWNFRTLWKIITYGTLGFNENSWLIEHYDLMKIHEASWKFKIYPTLWNFMMHGTPWLEVLQNFIQNRDIMKLSGFIKIPDLWNSMTLATELYEFIIYGTPWLLEISFQLENNVYVHIFMYIFMYMFMYRFMYIFMYIFIYILIHIFTYLQFCLD